MRLPRASGVLLHPTSLPGRHGIGDLGAEAHAFVDFLAATGQRWWQILPLGPTGYGNSPYQSTSSFAGNPLLIDVDNLVERGWLAREACLHDPRLPVDHVDFDAVAVLKEGVAAAGVRGIQGEGRRPAFRGIHRRQSRLARRLRALPVSQGRARAGSPGTNGNRSWSSATRRRCARWRERLTEGIRYHEFVQYAFEIQWQELRAACREQGVMLIGDLPIFVAHDSADVWANPELFYLDKRGQPLVVAGVPPDYFSETGQYWGNPLYRWDAHAADDYAWWAARLRFLLGRVDIVRIDHFRGFEAYWEIPAGSPTAASGKWVEGPGSKFFEALRRRLGHLPLDRRRPGRDHARRRGAPRRVQPAGNAGPSIWIQRRRRGREAPAAPVRAPLRGLHRHARQRHDPRLVHLNRRRDHAIVGRDPGRAGLRLPLHEHATATRFHWDMIRLAFSSVADTAIIPLQDILGLDSRARMNMPGKAEGNWRWRFQKGQIDQQAHDRLAELTAVYSRWNGAIPEDLDPRSRPKNLDQAPAPGDPPDQEPQTAP